MRERKEKKVRMKAKKKRKETNMRMMKTYQFERYFVFMIKRN